MTQTIAPITQPTGGPLEQPMPGWSLYRPAKWIRVSAFTEYLRCPRRYFYHYGCGLVPIEFRLALHFGEALHASIGWLLGHPGDFEGSLTAFDKVWTPEMEAFRETKEGKNRNKTVAIKMILHWLSLHAPGKSIWEPVPPPRNLPGLVPTEDQSDFEVPFAIDIGLDILLVGRIDAMCLHRDTGDLWLWELKTGSEFSWWLLPQAFDHNTQLFCYNLAMRALGLETKGTMVELLLASDRRQDLKLIPTYVSEHHLNNTLKLLRYKVGEMLEYQKRQDFPMDWTGCNTYSSYGSPGFPCDYTRLCNTPDWTIYKDTYKVEDDRPFLIQPTVKGA